MCSRVCWRLGNDPGLERVILLYLSAGARPLRGLDRGLTHGGQELTSHDVEKDNGQAHHGTKATPYVRLRNQDVELDIRQTRPGGWPPWELAGLANEERKR